MKWKKWKLSLIIRLTAVFWKQRPVNYNLLKNTVACAQFTCEYSIIVMMHQTLHIKRKCSISATLSTHLITQSTLFFVKSYDYVYYGSTCFKTRALHGLKTPVPARHGRQHGTTRPETDTNITLRSLWCMSFWYWRSITEKHNAVENTWSSSQ